MKPGRLILYTNGFGQIPVLIPVLKYLGSGRVHPVTGRLGAAQKAGAEATKESYQACSGKASCRRGRESAYILVP